MNVETRQRQILAKVKVHLLSGKTITDAQARAKWNTNRLSEYIRRCRKWFGMKVVMEWQTENGYRYGRYHLDIQKKESRISNQNYR